MLILVHWHTQDLQYLQEMGPSTILLRKATHKYLTVYEAYNNDAHFTGKCEHCITTAEYRIS